MYVVDRILELAEQDISLVQEKVRFQIQSMLPIVIEKFSEDEIKLYKDAFDMQYSDPDDLVGHFIVQIEKHLSKWDDKVYFAPYISLVQSSGCGKSRLLKEVASKKVYVVYVNLRSQSESGFPLHLPFSDRFVKWQDQVEYENFLVVMLELISKTEDDPVEFFEKCLTGEDGFWESIAEKVETRSRSEKDLKIIRAKLTTAAARNMISRIKTKENGLTLKVVFAFDEARRLLPDKHTEGLASFYHLRRALSILPTTSDGFAFAVMTDTLSKVSSLSPSSDLDFSARINTDSHLLYPPSFFTYMDLGDPLSSKGYLSDQVLERMGGSFTLKQLGTPLHLASYGRPLWITTCLKALESPTSTPSSVALTLIRLARRKMIGGRKFELWNKEVATQEEIYGILSCIYDISASLDNHVVETLVTSSMCVLGYVSDDRRTIRGKYASEPILVEGATHCLIELGAATCLSRYFDFLKRLIPAGETGEFIARFLLTHSVQLQSAKDIYSSTRFSKVITVKTFFESLLVDSSKVASQLPQELKDGLVFLTHFRRFNYVAKLPDLREAFARGMGIICQPNERGIDLIIPVCMARMPEKKASNTSTNDEEMDLEEEEVQDPEIKDVPMSAIFIQVKNRQSSFSLSKTSNLMDLSKIDAEITPGQPYVTLLMSLWQTTKKYEIDVEKLREKRLHATIQGLDKYRCLNENSDLQEACKAIIDHRFSLEDVYGKDSDELKFAKGMFPLEFKKD